MAHCTGLIPNETEIPCQTLVACLVHTPESVHYNHKKHDRGLPRCSTMPLPVLLALPPSLSPALSLHVTPSCTGTPGEGGGGGLAQSPGIRLFAFGGA